LARISRYAITFGYVICLASTHAAIIEIRWTDAGTFAHTLTVAPGKIAELCGEIDPKTPVEWKFSADTPLAFNIHRHQGKDVIYAIRRDSVRELNGNLASPTRYEWCWMWMNDSRETIRVETSLSKQ
jgi:hypothetical protein